MVKTKAFRQKGTGTYMIVFLKQKFKVGKKNVCIITLSYAIECAILPQIQCGAYKKMNTVYQIT